MRDYGGNNEGKSDRVPIFTVPVTKGSQVKILTKLLNFSGEKKLLLLRRLSQRQSIPKWSFKEWILNISVFFSYDFFFLYIT